MGNITEETTKLLKDMSVQCVPNGQEEFSSFLSTLLQAHGHKNKKLRIAILKSFQNTGLHTWPMCVQLGKQTFPQQNKYRSL